MDSKILLGKILQRFEDLGYAQVPGYFRFIWVRETNNSVIALRENGKQAVVPFAKILNGIELYQKNPLHYEKGPVNLREAHILHVTSPIFALLHLLSVDAYRSMSRKRESK